MSSTLPLDVRAPAKTPEAKEPAYSEDRVLNRIGQVFMLLITAAGFGASYLAFGVLGMMFPGLLAMCFGMGVFGIVEPALRGQLAERKVRKLLRLGGIPAVHDIYLVTGDGRRTQLDHVVFLGKLVAVIETKSIIGTIERRGGVWSRLLHGRERRFAGRTPQQQALDARDVLLAAYPAWSQSALAVTVLTHGTLGDSFDGESWVVTIEQLGTALGRLRHLPNEAGLRRWADLARFLSANRRTRADKMRFWRSHVLKPKNFGRGQLVAFGIAMGSGLPLIAGSLNYSLMWFLVRVVPHWLAGSLAH